MLFPDFLERIIVERALGSDAVERIERGLLPRQLIEPVARAVGEMSKLFTRHRDQLPVKYLRKNLCLRVKSNQSYGTSPIPLYDISPARAAYLLYFFPLNFPKIQVPIHELLLYHNGFLGKPNLRVLDIGCGPGTALLGMLDYLSRSQSFSSYNSIQFVAVDQLRENLTDCQWIFSRYMSHLQSEKKSRCEIELETLTLDLARLSKVQISKLLGIKGRYDLIIASNTLNELFPKANDPIKRRAELLAQISDELLLESGNLVIIEPALRTTSRCLLAVRNQLTLRYGLTIYSPCVNCGVCPLLTEGRGRDWCHVVYPYRCPQIVSQIDHLIGTRNDSLKFAYIIARKDNRRLSDLFPTVIAPLWRAVGDMLRVKGQNYIWMCGKGGFKKHLLFNRNLSDNNSDFLKIKRGNIVSIGNVLEDGTVRKLSKDSIVKIHN